MFAFGVKKHWQMEKGVRPGGSFSLLAHQQDRKLDIHWERVYGGIGRCM